MTEAGGGAREKTKERVKPISESSFLINRDLSADDIQKNIKKVVAMSPVAELSGTEFEKSEIPIVDQIESYFKTLNNTVTSKYGLVDLTKKGIKSSIGHGIGRNKAIAFKAVPDVIKSGEIIDYQVNWKNRGYDTAVFAAPIKISSIDYYLAAVVIVEKSRNSYYLHEIALQKKKITQCSRPEPIKTALPAKRYLLYSYYYKKLQNVNRENQESEGQFSIPEKSSDGQKLTDEQREFFRNSKVRDEKGRLLAVYHGTKRAGFTTLNKNKRSFAKKVFF